MTPAKQTLEDENRMSKIMRQLYAEARAAREAALNANALRVRDGQPAVRNPAAPETARPACWALPLSNPAASARSTLQWWNRRIAMARERFIAAPG
jgi:hypothetical protein